MIRYIENIDIVSYRRKNIEFLYIAMSFICHYIFDISRYFTPEVCIFITALSK